MKTLDKLMKSGRLDKIWSGIDTELKPWEWNTGIFMICLLYTSPSPRDPH